MDNSLHNYQEWANRCVRCVYLCLLNDKFNFCDSLFIFLCTLHLPIFPIPITWVSMSQSLSWQILLKYYFIVSFPFFTVVPGITPGTFSSVITHTIKYKIYTIEICDKVMILAYKIYSYFRKLKNVSFMSNIFFFFRFIITFLDIVRIKNIQ